MKLLGLHDLQPDGRRLNALTLTGLPISYLKTQALFSFSAHFDSAPTGLEWINDWTVVFVYPSTKAAKLALRNLRKFLAEDPDEDDFLTAKPIPVNMWPPGSRVKAGLNGELNESARDMKQRICIRVARSTDVKEKGARSASEFYKKYGRKAGKEMYDFPEATSTNHSRQKRRRESSEEPEEVKRARLDAELDALNSEGNDVIPGIGLENNERSLRSRISERRGGKQIPQKSRSMKTSKQSLDDELEAFLRERD